MSVYVIHLFDRNLIPAPLGGSSPATEPGRIEKTETLEEAQQIAQANSASYERIIIFRSEDMDNPVEDIRTDKNKGIDLTFQAAYG